MPDTAILVIGPGAVGCLVAARLARAGERICLLDHRPERAARMKALRLTESNATDEIPITVSADPSVAARFERIMVCVKAFQTTAVANQIMPYVRPSASILSLQNGLGNLDLLQRLNGRDIRPAVMNAGARVVSEGHVLATGGHAIVLAGKSSDPLGRMWRDDLTRAGFSITFEPDAQRLIWSKLVINAAINPVTALYRIVNGDVLRHPEASILARELLLESVRIGRDSGVALDADAIWLQRLQAICETTRENRSSMLCDIEAGRQTEIEAINGAILQQARQHHLDAPATARLLEQWRSLNG